MFSLKSVSTHVAVDVADLDAATKHAEETLGLSKIREITPEGIGRIVWYDGLELTQADPGVAAWVVKHVAWEVEDIREAMAELKSRGVEFESEEPLETPRFETGEVILYAFFRTPVGLPGELIEVRKP